jgi:hypothetical protein
MKNYCFFFLGIYTAHKVYTKTYFQMKLVPLLSLVNDKSAVWFIKMEERGKNNL